MLPLCSATHAATRASDSGHVADLDHDPREPATAHHAALDDLAQHQRIDVAAAQDEGDPLAREALAVAQQRRERRGARAFDDRLFDLEEHHDRLLDVALVHEENFLHVALDDRQRESPRLLHRDALGDCGSGEFRRRPLHRVVHAGKALHLHAVNDDGGLMPSRRSIFRRKPRPPPSRPRAHPGPGARAASPARTCLPRDDPLVVVGMDQRGLRSPQPSKRVLRAVEVVALEESLPRRARASAHLHERRVARHHDGGGIRGAWVIRHALRVVPRGASDDTACAQLGRERGKLVVRPAP